MLFGINIYFRFADRDMVMRYYLGFGIGHVYTNPSGHLHDDLNEPEISAMVNLESGLTVDDSVIAEKLDDEDIDSIDFDWLSSTSKDNDSERLMGR